MGTYAEFLERRAQLDGMSGFDPLWMPDFLFPFQQAMTDWAIRQGRGGLFEDCGLGKTAEELVWAQNVHQHTGKPVLLLTPLAVTFQMATEAAKFGIDAAMSRDGKVTAPVTVTNYERLDHFDRDEFGGVVCDESSAIKAFDGVAPRDGDRLPAEDALPAAGHRHRRAERLRRAGHLQRGAGLPRLHGHARPVLHNNKQTATCKAIRRVWRRAYRRRRGGSRATPRIRSGAGCRPGRGRCASRPTSGSATTGSSCRRWSTASTSWSPAAVRRTGTLFDVPAVGLREEREEPRRTLTERCEKAAELLGDADPGIAWCQLNDEGDLLARLIEGAVEVSGLRRPGRERGKAGRVQPRRDPGPGHQAEHRRVGPELAALPPDDLLPLALLRAVLPGGPPLLAVRPAAPGDRRCRHDPGRRGRCQPRAQGRAGRPDVRRPDRAHGRRAGYPPQRHLRRGTEVPSWVR